MRCPRAQKLKKHMAVRDMSSWKGGGGESSKQTLSRKREIATERGEGCVCQALPVCSVRKEGQGYGTRKPQRARVDVHTEESQWLQR